MPLIVASAILYLGPNDTGRLFAWPIKRPMTAMMLGAAYMGGIYFFSRVIAARIVLEAQALSIALILIAALRTWGEFNPSSATTQLFIGGPSGLLIGIAVMYLSMEARGNRMHVEWEVETLAKKGRK